MMIELVESKMLIELSYVVFSLLLVIYSVWRYYKRRERILLYLTLSFTFLASSTTLQLIRSLILAHRVVLRVLELASLGMFACFIVLIIIALEEIFKTPKSG